MIKSGSSYPALSKIVLPKLSCMSSSLLFQSTRYVMLYDGKSHITFVSVQAHDMYCSIMVKSSMPALYKAPHSNKMMI